MFCLLQFNQMASTSYPCSSRKWTYDVFMSFNGHDTRLNFVDHLYSALHDRSIYTFKDDQKLRRGKSISSELLKAIEQSKFAIVVFSKNYASSSWCLDELVKIIECKNLSDLTVLPVFYDVDPSEVRKQTGCFMENFVASSSYNDKWRKALSDAAGISGWDIRNTANGHESRCIKQIVGYILTNLGHATISSNAKNLVGMQSRVSSVKSLLRMGTDDNTRIIGIWGMGGIGKTTVTRALFDDISSCHFEGRSFVANVREVSRTSSGLESLQEQVLSDIQAEKDLKVPNIHEGIIMMSRLFSNARVLLVLDDVDHVTQLVALAGKRDWFGKGSRIIITTRDKQLLDIHGVDEIHRAILLNDEESLHLFSRYAFKRSSPPDEYLEPSRLVVRNVGGLPLALNVLGSFLYGRDVIEWTSALDRLKDIPENEILDVLKISFDGLRSIEKELFLDIACFFVGTSKDVAIQILDSFDFHPVIGISVLVQKSLLTVSNGKLEMHDLIQEMGWHIVRQFYPKEPGKHSRLWLTEDVVNVLTKNTGTEAIEGIKLDWSCGIECNNIAFRNMKKLRLLYVHTVLYNRQPQKLEYLSNELRWIYWPGCPFDSLPNTFQPENLVHLEMPRSQIVQLWTGEKAMKNLKFVELSNSYALTSTPDFSGAPNLERLILKRCANIEEVHPSVGDLKSLVLLDFTDCRELKSLPPCIKMTSLETLILTGCSKLAVFPQILVNIESLTRLSLKGTAIKELPSSIENLTGILFLDLCYCTNLIILPNSICSLKRLRSLLLSGCTKFEELPENLGRIESLEELELGNTAIRQPPSSIGLLKNLNKLSFTGSKPIMKSQLQPNSSSFCFSLLKRESWISVGLVLPCLSGCQSLRQLDLSYCDLFEIPVDLRLLTSLEELNLSGNYFTFLPAGSICQLSQLKILVLDHCRNLEELPDVPSSIGVLVADQCRSLKSLVSLSLEHRWLWKVSFLNCFNQGIVKDIADILLHTLLQGNAVIDHRFSIVLPGREIPNWFTHQGKGKFPCLQLPPKWQNNIMGFAFCLVLDSSYPSPRGDGYIDLRNKNDAVTAHFKYYSVSEHMLFERDHIWMGYVSIHSIFKKYVDSEHHNRDGWFKIGEVDLSIFLDWVPGKCGLCLVHKEDVKLYSQSMIKDSSQSRSYEFLRLNNDFDMHVTSVFRSGDFI